MSLSAENSRGVRLFAISTAKDLLIGPERALAVTNLLNQEIENPAEWVGVEVYTTMPLRPLLVMRQLSKKLGLPSLIPPHVTPESIRELQKTYKHTKITGFHGPFNGTWPETFHRMTIGELENGPMQMAYQVAWALFFGPPALKSAINLVKEFDVPLNLHTNVINDLLRTGDISKLNDVTVLLENERKYRPLKMARELAHDPIKIAEYFIIREHIGQGLTLGLDHTTEQNSLLDQYLKDPLVRKYTRAMHLAQVGINHLGQVGHGPIQTSGNLNSEMLALLQLIGNTKFKNPVRAIFNFVTSFSQKKSIKEEAKELKQMIATVASFMIC